MVCCYDLRMLFLGRPQFLASGDACGVVKVWRLSTQLTAVASNEVEQLNSLATDTVAASTGTL